MSVSNEKSNGRKSWNLLCDCGKIVVKETSSVNKLVSTSNCGCKGRMKPTGLCVREVICGEGRF